MGNTQNIEENNKNKHKPDTFSLGMTILELITLEKSSDLYDKSSFRLKYRDFENRLHKVEKLYSNKLKRIMNLLLNIDPSERLSPKQVYRRLCGKSIFDEPIKPKNGHTFFFLFLLRNSYILINKFKIY